MVPKKGTLSDIPTWELSHAAADQVKLVGRKVLMEFIAQHADVRSQVEAWVAEVQEASWRTPPDLKARHPSASFVGENRVIFNLKGTKYRLDAKVSFKNQTIIVIRMGTHAEYDSWKF